MNRSPARASVLLAAAALTAVALVGCGDSDDSKTAATPTAPVTSAPATTAPSTTAGSPGQDGQAGQSVQNISITMSGSKVDPAPGTIEIDKGTKVRLSITRDSDGEIHLHGFGDLSEDAKAGVPVVFEFVADEVGVFEVEAHHPDRLLTKLQVS